MATTIDFIGEIHKLIALFQEQAARHEAVLERYYDSNDVWIPSKYTDRGEQVPYEYEDYKEDLDAEAYDARNMLEEVMDRLRELAGPPVAGQVFTLTVAGSERHDGEAPYLFVVSGEDIGDARRRLETLPFFREWCEEQRPWDEPDADPDIEFLDEARDSHPGLPAAGAYNDLRREQAVLAEAENVVADLAARLPEQEG
ncbi:hypothetical protein ACFXKF_36170 [Streptomyces scopuliridis]|uniref:hypothetical protein n=1 Tax=Streptomyces scopuliridis TaxID=452529 RepID=UPI0036B28282